MYDIFGDDAQLFYKKYHRESKGISNRYKVM